MSIPVTQPQINVTPASPHGGVSGSGGDSKPFRRVNSQLYQSAPLSYPSAPPPTSYNNNPYQSSFAAPPPVSHTPVQDDGSVWSKISVLSSQIEDMIDTFSQPLKPYLPGLGRFLIVGTFLEDALRIVTQWRDQLYYLERHRKFPWGLSHFFLLINICVMLSCSGLVVAKRFPEASIAGLLAVVISQGFGYGLMFDLNFFLRNLSVVGGLLMVLSDSLSKRKHIFAGIPSIGTETERRTYFQLAGRVLLIFLFIGFIMNGSLTIPRIIVSIIGLAACLMVAVGFKAKWSAMFLVLILSVFNLFINNWWTVHSAHPERDFMKYDFFQTLSIVGGLLLLVSVGPGGLSVDEKKKVY